MLSGSISSQIVYHVVQKDKPEAMAVWNDFEQRQDMILLMLLREEPKSVLERPRASL